MQQPMTTIPAPPITDQWSVLYHNQAQQTLSFQQQQQQRQQLRKLVLKEALEENIKYKNDHRLDEKVMDRVYGEHAKREDERAREEERRKDEDRRAQRRRIQEVNRGMLAGCEQPKMPHLGQNNLALNIGQPDPQKRTKLQNAKKLSQHLQSQLQSISTSLQKQRQSELQQQLRDQRIIAEKQQQRELELQRRRGLMQGQNSRIYGYYERLKEERDRKDRELNHTLVDRAAAQNRAKQQARMQQEQQERSKQSIEMKDSLIMQIQKHQKQKQRTPDPPQQYSYKLLDRMFEDKRQRYDKNEYLQVLLKQVRVLKKQEEEHKRKRYEEKRMSDEEYRLNMNQLNKAVNGAYRSDGYRDRSTVSIGDPVEASRKKDELYFRGRSQNSIAPAVSAQLPSPVQRDSESIRRRIEQLLGHRG